MCGLGRFAVEGVGLDRSGAQKVPHASPQHNHLSTGFTVIFDVDSEILCCQKKSVAKVVKIDVFDQK